MNEQEFLQAGSWEKWQNTETDQRKHIPPPAPQKPYPPDAELVELVAAEALTVGDMPLRQVIARRKSRRKYTPEPLTLEELSFLLWATQGVRSMTDSGRMTRRTVPSGGSRHPFETYLSLHNVTDVKPGLYRYLPLDHKLYFLRNIEGLAEQVAEASERQVFVKDAAVVFIWTALPYRTAWRYANLSPKIIAQDSGHLCQNLYLASEAIGAGTCAIGAYNQEQMDELLGVDGKKEFTIYVAPVGKIK